MPPPFRLSRLRVPVVGAGFLAAIALMALTPLAVAAIEPIDLREPVRQPADETDPEAVADLLRELASRSADSGQPSSPVPEPAPSRAAPGYDVSYPQCGAELPDAFSFAIVGVNGGRVHSENPCLGPGDDPSQLLWAGPDTDLYANTGNPGPEPSRYWPHGQTEPRACDTDEAPGADTPDCAYVYGWNAAAHAYGIALDAFIALGWAEPDEDALSGDATWWLDVEVANSWRGNRALNVAALRGAVDYLASREVAEIGFYSTPRLWNRITGGTDVFAEHPAWHAGARDLADAQERCNDAAFTGGELRMVQWVEDGVDANYRCP
jgi:hypothetical protein